MDPDCLSENMSISSQSINQQLGNVGVKINNNICKKHKYKPTSGSCANVKLTYLAINYQDSSKLLKIFEPKVHLMRYIKYVA